MTENDFILFDRIEVIKKTIEKYGEENFYISFSGGKDSTVLHHLIDEAIPDNKIPRVFMNTGIEYNDIRRFVEELTENDFILFDRIEVIKKTIEKYGEENFYISFSGGKDSTVLHHLIDEAIPDNKIPRVFMNTGIEYNDIRRFVEELTENDFRFVILNSKVNIPQMLKEKGYPFKSKEHSCKLSMFQKKGTETKSVSKYINEKSFGCPDVLKYQFTDSFNLKVSDRCCYELKKHPIQRYEKESGRNISILGLRMGEGGQRANHEGCVVFDSNHELKKFKPLNPCSNEFIEWYIESRNIELCRLYYHPFDFKRTGCKGCPYAIDLQDQLEIMDKYFPNERKQCELIWKPVYEEYRRIGYRLKRIEEKRLF